MIEFVSLEPVHKGLLVFFELLDTPTQLSTILHTNEKIFV